MSTIADNIMAMARIVRDAKNETRLSENTILRIVDMNLTLALNAAPPPATEIIEPEPETQEETL